MRGKKCLEANSKDSGDNGHGWWARVRGLQVQWRSGTGAMKGAPRPLLHPSLCLGGRAKKVTPSPFSRSPSLEISKEGRRRDVAAKGVLVEGLVIFPWPLQGFQKL
ncbi:hypothetical protein GW17_00040473, partial [Ensete ventricosum]